MRRRQVRVELVGTWAGPVFVTGLAQHTAFDALFDDAAIFPPGNVPMPAAIERHRGYAGNSLVGPFVCSLTRLPELDTLLESSLDVSLVIPAGPFEIPVTERARIVSVERHADAAGVSPQVRTYIELATLPCTGADLHGVQRVKFRTGGLTANAFPSVRTLATAITTTVAAGVPFKCTAGLHNAVRHTSAEGFEHHGFVNILLATHAALFGGDVTALLCERDGTVLSAGLRAVPAGELTRTRTQFVSVGTCSITEPTADLRALGLLS